MSRSVLSVLLSGPKSHIVPHKDLHVYKGEGTRKTMIILNKNSESNTTLFHYNLLKQVL